MNNDGRVNPFSRFVKAAAKIEPHELRATSVSFAFVFTLMAAYFIMRPVRDAMSSEWSDEELSWLWTSTFFFSVVAVSLYGAIISRVRFKRLVPGVYSAFAASFAGFYLAGTTAANADLVNKAFYVWLSVFSLFHLSVFWSYMSGLFSKDQAPRLFAVIATGASTGAIVGPSIPAFFADNVGTMNLLLLSAAMLLIPIAFIGILERLRVTDLGTENVQPDLTREQKLGRNPFSGFKLFVSNPFLLGIGLFILFYVIMNTFVYFELRKLLAGFDRDVRTQIWAGIDLAVNSLAIVTAIFATGRISTRFGMATTLALIPVLMVGGWLIVAATPLLAVLIGLQVARRAGNYAITRPGREMLFTVVDAETRFKAKPVIDIVVYRGGDMMTAWTYTVLTATLGLGLTGVALFAAVIAAGWAIVGASLGRAYGGRAAGASLQPASRYEA